MTTLGIPWVGCSIGPEDIEAVSTLEISISKNIADTIPALAWRGMTMLKLGKPANAALDFDECLTQLRNNSVGYGQWIRHCSVGRGLALEETGKLELARESYSEALEAEQWMDVETPPELAWSDEQIKKRITTLKAKPNLTRKPEKK